MTINDVNQMWDSVERDTSIGNGEYRTRRRLAWQVLHSPDERDDVIEFAPNVRLGDPYGVLPHVRAIGRRAVRMSPIMSHVFVDYEGIIGERERDPFDSRPKINFSTVTTTENIDEDVNGNPIMTAAGERYDNITDDFADRVITIQRNFATFSTSAVDVYLRAYNSDPFLNYAPGQVRTLTIDADGVYVGDTNNMYFSVIARFQARTISRASRPERTWWKRVRHEGYYCNVPDPFNGGALIKALARVKGKPVTRPVLLDVDGQMLPDNTTSAKWQEWNTRIALPFFGLGLLR